METNAAIMARPQLFERANVLIALRPCYERASCARNFCKIGGDPTLLWGRRDSAQEMLLIAGFSARYDALVKRYAMISPGSPPIGRTRPTIRLVSVRGC